MKSIDNTTKEVNKMRDGILAWAVGTNLENEDASFLRRNRTKIYTAVLFGSLLAAFYLLDWTLFFRIMGMMCTLWLITTVITMTRRLFKK